MKKLHFKFQAGCNEGKRQALLQRLTQQHASQIQRLFPKENDDELAALYTLSTEDETSAEKLLAILNANPDIEFAEPEVQRKLIT